ncbi:hypothetical protein MMPV_001765 [Pyropia vietnamensis]
MAPLHPTAVATAATAFALAIATAVTPAAGAVLRWNAGGGAAGGGFGADVPPGVTVSGGWAYQSGKAIDGTRLDSMYASHRAGKFGYTVSVKPGTYALRLHVAETWAPNYKRGARVQTLLAGDGVSITGRATRVDPYALAGGKERAAVVSMPAVKVGSSGKLIIQCVSIVQNCLLSGVTISTRSSGAGFLSDQTGGGGGGGSGGGGNGSSSGGKGNPGKENNGGFDHRSHAVPGAAYAALDFDGNGQEVVELDGGGSHTHYFDAVSGKGGKIVKYEWTNVATGAVLGRTQKISATFPLGTTTVKLTVTDTTGDVASDTTTVTVSSGAAGGWWCYWMRGISRLPPRWVTAAPRPIYAAPSAAVRFGDGKYGWAGFSNPWVKGWGVRCVGFVTVPKTGKHSFTIKANGPVGLYVGTKAVVLKPSAGPATVTSTETATLAAGANLVTVVHWHKYNNLGILEVTTPAGSTVSHASQKLLPVVTALSKTSGDPSGGSTIKLSGSGFFNGEKVFFGSKQATIINDGGGTSSDSIYVKTPAGKAGFTVSVKVHTKNGISNALKYTYVGGGGSGSAGSKDVKYVSTHLKNKSGTKFTSVPLATSIALGADGLTYYVGSLTGNVYAVRMINHYSMTVGSYCKGPWSGKHRVITGVSVNPARTDGNFVYASSSVINYRNPSIGLSIPEGWANGRIELYAVGGPNCMTKVKDVITGLPVSAHDHTINGMAWTNDGNLLLHAGSSTNAGYNGPGSEKSGYVDESPLSAATLIAYISKGSSFDGHIKYNQMSNPTTAKQTSGDVAVYSSGVRNAYGILRHSSGAVYALDNGGNNGYGDVRTGCGATAHVPWSGAGNPKDSLLLLKKGAYYGHPNLNRARTDARQCVYRQPSDASGGRTPALATVSPSTNGITEMRSSVFDGALKGDLFFTKYVGGAAGATGFMSTTTVKKGGGIGGISFFFQSGGLSVTANPMGAFIMTRTQQGFFAAATPVYSPGSGPKVMGLAPHRGPMKGGYRVYVAGYNFGSKPTVKVGAKTCTAVKVVSKYGLTCTMPAGAANAKVAVSVNGSPTYGFDFEYMSV